ncbi:hypothetical protein E4T56_gene12468 [Termitomyces sp. T112]|nr:hypothetical protein E4T56_gene12468 [Termitomyces sp. T112]
MPFQVRNPYYLRISEKNVLPLYLYLDERHLDWMSDVILQHVLADLRPHILPKLKKEVTMTVGAPSNTKKSTLDTYRGETYQFCYFFRKTEPHSVVVKARTFVAIPPQKQPTMPPPSSLSRSQRSKRKSRSVAEKGFNEGARKKRKTKGKGRAPDEDDELSTSSNENSDYDPAELQRSKRTANSNHAEDVNMLDQTFRRDTPSTIELEIDQEEEKPKPVLQLKYQGFDIFGHCLCVVVEPWPPVRSMSRVPSVNTLLNREPSIAPPQRAQIQEPDVRGKTPLFLPDDYRERSETPALFRDRSIPPPPTGSLLDPRLLEDSDEDSDEGMMLFSQVLNNVGDTRAGAADDDEDMDIDMFFGDADERREL